MPQKLNFHHALHAHMLLSHCLGESTTPHSTPTYQHLKKTQAENHPFFLPWIFHHFPIEMFMIFQDFPMVFPCFSNGFSYDPLVMTSIAMENDPCIDDFPSYKSPFIVDSPWLCES